MTPATDTNAEWRDGFLFVANSLSLDFLNTRPTVDGEPMELLPDNVAFARWLRAAGLLEGDELPEWEGTKDRATLLEFREQLRYAVLRHESGQWIPNAFVTRLNELLRKHPSCRELVVTEDGYARQTVFRPTRLADAFAPIVEDTLNLLTADQSKVRKCDGCTVHFLDTSKKGVRRWCSMNLCGNRAKVAAYARRQKQQ